MTETTAASTRVPVSIQMIGSRRRRAHHAGAAIVAVAAVTALVLRHRFPHHLGSVPSRVRAAR
jgi:hypothetical protein